MIQPKTRLVILIGYWILGLIATHVPMGDSGEVMIPNLDKIAHFILYLFLSLLMAYWLGYNRPTKKTASLTFLICVGYALLDEGGQTLILSRHASVGDFVADVLGSLAGVLLYSAIRAKSNSIDSTNNTNSNSD